MIKYGGKSIIMISDEYKLYLKKLKVKKILVGCFQILIIFIFLFIWEYLSRREIINSFIFSAPSKIWKTIYGLYKTNNLFNHIFVTLYESIVSFTLSTVIGTLIAILLWLNKFIYKVLEPYLTMLNSLPKVALGPVIIILLGANIKSIIVMALLISLFVTITNVYSGFVNTDKIKVKLMNSFGAKKSEMLRYLIIPSNYNVIISSLKVNVGLSLVGVIMGEFLVSKEGIGYLINYGSEVFNLDIVYLGIILLLLVSYLMYIGVKYLEKVLIKRD